MSKPAFRENYEKGKTQQDVEKVYMQLKTLGACDYNSKAWDVKWWRERNTQHTVSSMVESNVLFPL